MQKITVTLTAPDGIDAEKFIAELADRARYTSVLVTPAVYATVENVTFVSAETVPDPEPVPVQA